MAVRDDSARLHACRSDFDLKYIGADNTEHRPVVIHRAIFGSFERFIAILIEHYAGAFPLWLAPVQAVVLPISDRHLDYARVGARPARRPAGLRADLDERQEKIGYKIREAQLQKVPYMLVVGDRESAEGTVSVRSARGRRSWARSRLTAFVDAGARKKSTADSSGKTPRRLAASSRRLLSLSTEVPAATIASASTSASASAKSA